MAFNIDMEILERENADLQERINRIVRFEEQFKTGNVIVVNEIDTAELDRVTEVLNTMQQERQEIGRIMGALDRLRSEDIACDEYI